MKNRRQFALRAFMRAASHGDYRPTTSSSSDRDLSRTRTATAHSPFERASSAGRRSKFTPSALWLASAGLSASLFRVKEGACSANSTSPSNAPRPTRERGWVSKVTALAMFFCVDPHEHTEDGAGRSSSKYMHIQYYTKPERNKGWERNNAQRFLRRPAPDPASCAPFLPTSDFISAALPRFLFLTFALV